MKLDVCWSCCLKHHLHIWEIKLPFSFKSAPGFSAISYCKSPNNHFNLISHPEQIRFANLACFCFSCDIRIERCSVWRQITISIDIFSRFFLSLFKTDEESCCEWDMLSLNILPICKWRIYKSEKYTNKFFY